MAVPQNCFASAGLNLPVWIKLWVSLEEVVQWEKTKLGAFLI